MPEREKKTQPKPTAELMNMAMSMALGLVDSDTMKALLDAAKLQYQVYKNFIGLGCSEKEAATQTTIFMQAMMSLKNNSGGE